MNKWNRVTVDQRDWDTEIHPVSDPRRKDQIL